MLLVSPGKPFASDVVRAAVALARGEEIQVLSVAKIYGTAFGLQHPGLLPSKRELKVQEDIVAAAISEIEAMGGTARGEVVGTRNNAKTFRRAAERYGVRHVVLAPYAGSALRKIVEGDPASSLRRHLGQAVQVHVVAPASDG